MTWSKVSARKPQPPTFKGERECSSVRSRLISAALVEAERLAHLSVVPCVM